MNDDKRRAMKVGLRKRMSRQAEARTCPNCKRKMALSKHKDDLGVVTYCRYKDCDYEHALMWGT